MYQIDNNNFDNEMENGVIKYNGNNKDQKNIFPEHDNHNNNKLEEKELNYTNNNNKIFQDKE